MTFDERMIRYFERKPSVHNAAFVAPGAVVLGDVTIAEESSIWFNATLRADINSITIGPRSNIQDGAVVHVDDDFPAVVGEYVTCGHKAILHGCTVDNEVLVGMNSTLLDGVRVGARSIIGADALLTMNTDIPPGSLVLGSPGKIVRQLSQEEQRSIKGWATRYIELSRRYLDKKW